MLGLARAIEQPAHVRVPEPGDRPLYAAAVAVRRVWVALLVGVRVVLAVVGDPRHHRSLDRDGAEDRQRVLDRLVRLERAVGEQAVEAERHAVAGDHVHDRQHREIAPVDQRVPQQDDGDDEAEEREQDPGEVEPAVHGGHGVESYPQSQRSFMASGRLFGARSAVAS